MPLNNNYIAYYDFETSGTDPNQCEPIQLAGCIIHPRKLEVIDSFDATIRLPDGFIMDEDTLAFHANAHKITKAEMKAKIDAGKDQKTAWNDWVAFIDRYRGPGRKGMFNAVVRAGHNIKNFDNIIWQRLCTRYGQVGKNGEQNIAFPRDNLDTQDMLWWWFENHHDAPEKLNMNVLRDYFGFSSEKGHTADNDVVIGTEILIRFMKFFRNISASRSFRGSFL